MIIQEVFLLKLFASKIIAHRGYYNNKIGIPENSFFAFKRALKCGYAIEFDVHVLKDGSVVIFHDDDLKRMCGVLKKIHECTYDEIKNLKLLKTHEKIPLLKDVLKFVRGQVPLLIEIKKCYSNKERQKILEILKSYHGTYAIQSFYHDNIRWFKKRVINPVGTLSFYVSDSKKIKLFDKFLHKFVLKPSFVSYSIKLMPNAYFDGLKKQMPLLGWTVTNKKEYEEFKDYCDNLICDDILKYQKYI